MTHWVAAALRRGTACALLGLFAGGAMAQEPTPLPLTDKAPVVLDGRMLFMVGESGTWSAEERAKEINRTLLAAAASQPAVLVLAEHDGYPTIRMGDWHLLTVADSDVIPGMDAGEQAQRWLQSVEAALQQARTERSPAYRTSAAVLAFGAVVFAAASYWLLWRASRRLPLMLGRGLGLRRRSAYGGRPAWQTAIELTCFVLQGAVWLAALFYIGDRFPSSRQLRYDAGRLLGRSLSATLFTLNQRGYSALDILWLLGAIVTLFVIVNLITWLLSARLMRATGASRGALQPVATLLRYGLIFVGIIVILQIAGINLSSLAIFASVLGVGIGFGMQSIANNFVSGLILSFERPIKPGDFVSIGDLQGTVERIGGRSTIVRTLDRVSIIVPNAHLLDRELINWSYGDPLARLHLHVGVAYGSDIAAVRGALLDAAHAHSAVLPQPHPEVRFLGFGDNALDFELLVWSTDPSAQMHLRSDLFYGIEANLRSAGIEIPFPQRTLHVPAAEIDAIVGRLRGDTVAAPAPGPVAAAPRATPDPAAPASSAEPWHLGDLHLVVESMRGPNGLTIEDRRHLLSVYPKCFVGNEAVEWLMRTQDLSREEAVHLGQTMVERGIFHHVLDEHPFRDGNFYYRFYDDEGVES